MRQRARSGFTLVELLVVILIIGILVGMLLPAISAVRARVFQAGIATRLANLQRGLEAYREQFGDYPPDFSDVLPASDADSNESWLKSVAYRHIRKAWPKIDPVELNFIRLMAVNGNFDHANVLVFFLNGLSSDPKHPFTGPGGPLNVERSKGFHEFDAEDLVGEWAVATAPGPAKWPGGQKYYVDGGGRLRLPFLYFDARTYVAVQNLQNGARVQLHYAAYAQGANDGIARPYKSEEINGSFTAATDPPDMQFFYMNKESYQLHFAGRDNSYGKNDTYFDADFRGNNVSVPVLKFAREFSPYHPTQRPDPTSNVPSSLSGEMALHDDNMMFFTSGKLLEDMQ